MLVDVLPIERVQRVKEIVDTMYAKSVQIVEEKKVAMRKGDDESLQDVMSILRTCQVLYRLA